MFYNMPVIIYEEDNCVLNHKKEIAGLGTRAIIVTGRSSSKKNGSLDDVKCALTEEGISYVVFDEIEENPSTDTVMRASDYGLQNKVDFVIGIGGGSPLDAAKAIAIMICNWDKGESFLFQKTDKVESLPIVAVPTTCGTGSEVTAVSVLTVHKNRTKASLPHRVFPKYALIDAKYLMNAPMSVITATAIDTLAHIIESYINTGVSDFVRMFAKEGLIEWAKNKHVLLGKEAMSIEAARSLLHAAMLGGICIAHAGTTIPHSLSYMVTYEMGAAHGLAVGHFLPGYVRNAAYCDQQFIYQYAGFEDYAELEAFLNATCKVDRINHGLLERCIHSVVNNPAKVAACPYYFDDTILYQMERTKQNMKKGILFDLDGTLWDSSQAVVDSWNYALENYTEETYRCTLDMMRGFMGRTMADIAYLFFDRETKERAIELMDICMKYETQYMEEHGGILFDSLEDTLKALKSKGYFLAVVSNCQEGYIEAFLKYHKLEKYFDDIESYGRTGQDKDYNIKLVVERNKLDKAVYVGDIMSDYNATKKAGLPFIHAAYGFGSVPENTPRIESLKELPDVVCEVIGS